MATKASQLKGDVRNIWNEYDGYRQYWGNFFDRGRQAIKFYGGDQWDAEDMAKFQSAQRPVVTINLLAPLVRQVTGFRTRERLQPKVSPERDGTVEMAYVKSKLVYHILKKNHFHATNHDVNEDQVVTGRGWWELDIDYDDNPMGELKLYKPDWDEVIPDYMAKDPFYRDSRSMFRAKYVPRELIPKLYDRPGDLYAENEEGWVEWTDDDGRMLQDKDDMFRDMAGNVLVVERHKLVKKKVWYITDGETWRQVERRLTPDQLMAAFGPNVAQTSSMENVLMIDTIIPAESVDKIVSSKPAKLQLGSYNFIPAVCYRAGEKLMGIVEDLIDEQKRTNKSFSQMIEILGHSAKGLWLVPKSAGINEKQFKLNAARPGGMIAYDGKEAPQHVQTGVLPQGYAAIFEVSQQNMRNISGIRLALEGRSEYSGESGIKFAQKLQQAREQLAVVDRRFLDGFRYVCNQIVEAIPKVYDYSFAIQILEGDDNVKDLKVNEETLNGIMNDVVGDPGEYNVDIDMVAESTTSRQGELAELAEMMQGIPQFAAFFASEWVRGSDMADKEEKAKKIELLSGQMLQMEQMKAQLAMMAAQQGAQQGQAKQQAQAEKSKQSEALAQSKIAKNQAEIQKMAVDAEVSESTADVDNFTKMRESMREGQVA